MCRKKCFFVIIIFSLATKIALFAYASIKAPESQFLPDTYRYLDTGMTLVKTGSFARNLNGIISLETFRTPGYPIFLGILHGFLKIPFTGIIFIQILFTVLASLLVYRAAMQIDPKIAPVSAIIMLFDLPITIFSMILLTESLFLLLFSAFILAFLSYLKNKHLNFLIISAFTLVAATYVRPITYYLAIVISFFIVYAVRRISIKRAMIHAMIFFVCVYAPLGVWQYRNMHHTKRIAFSGIEDLDLTHFGLYKSYERNLYDKTKEKNADNPLLYYIRTSGRCLASLMTRPGTLKYFKSTILKRIGKAIGYPWVVFWLIGLLASFGVLRKSTSLQFLFIVMFYLIFISIVGVSLLVSSRFRVVMMPSIAILSAAGWHFISKLHAEKKVKPRGIN